MFPQSTARGQHGPDMPSGAELACGGAWPEAGLELTIALREAEDGEGLSDLSPSPSLPRNRTCPVFCSNDDQQRSIGLYLL